MARGLERPFRKLNNKTATLNKVSQPHLSIGTVVKSFYASEASDLEIKVNTFYASEASDPRIMRAKRALLERSERFASEASDLEMEKTTRNPYFYVKNSYLHVLRAQ